MRTAATRNRPPVFPSHPAALRERYTRMVRSVGATDRLIRMPGGGAVHVIESGDGPPVVHLHGNNTSSLSHLMLLEHSPRVRSILVDRPGFGLSDPDVFPRRAFRHHAVRFVTEVLDELGLGAAVLVGASGGGAWALWCALDHPERVSGLVLLGSVPLLPGSRIPVGIRIVATPVLGDVLTRVLRPGPRMLRRLMSEMGEGDTILRHPELFESLLDAAHDPVASAANVAEFQSLLTPFGTRARTRIRPDDLRHLTVPTLMIWGDHDPLVPVPQARAVAGLIPDAVLEVLPAGHVPQLGHPQQVALLVERFVESLA